MNRKRSFLPFVIVGAIVALIAAFFLTEDRRDDVELIREALNESIQASREGRPGGVMELLSDSFRLNDESPQRRQIADFIKRSRPDVEIPRFDPVINGDVATAVTPVKVKASFLGQSMEQEFQNVKVTFNREAATRWLFFPTRKWRLTRVEVPLDQVPQGFGF